MNVLIVGLGGGLGAAARYGIGLLPWRGSLPVSTLFVNLLGAVAIGVLSGFAVRRRMDDRLVLFVKTGLCGGFATFSAFSLESVRLIAAGNRGQVVLYIFLSLTGCLLGGWLGQALSRIQPE